MLVTKLPSAKNLSARARRCLYWHLERGMLLSGACRRSNVNYSRIRKDPDFTNCLLEWENGDHLRPKPAPEPKRTKEDAELEAFLQEIESRG
jgi:hypothetical protein